MSPTRRQGPPRSGERVLGARRRFPGQLEVTEDSPAATAMRGAAAAIRAPAPGPSGRCRRTRAVPRVRPYVGRRGRPDRSDRSTGGRYPLRGRNTAHRLPCWGSPGRGDGAHRRCVPPGDPGSWGLINRVVPAGRLAGEGRAIAIELATGATRAHIATTRILRAWRSGGVANADEANKAEGPAIMLSEDFKNGVESLKQYGLGHATFQGR